MQQLKMLSNFQTRGVAGVFIGLTTWSTSFILLQFFGVAVEVILQ